MRKNVSMEEYLRTVPSEARAGLDAVLTIVRACSPGAVETVKYGIPTFVLEGRNLMHVGGYATHIGVYPGAEAMEAFASRLAAYSTSKGTLRLPLDRPVPVSLLEEIVRHRVRTVLGKPGKLRRG